MAGLAFGVSDAKDICGIDLPGKPDIYLMELG
jgi:hypothetical protein